MSDKSNKIHVNIDDIIKELKNSSTAEVKEIEEERPKIFTGDAFLDLFYGGGIFHPGFIYVWGGEGSSKSTYAAQIALKFKRENPNSIVVVLDSEESFDKRRWINLGWEEEDIKQLLVIEPEYVESIRNILETIWEKIDTKKIPMLVIWDSVSSTTTKEEYVQEMDRLGTMARVISAQLRNWKLRKYNTSFIAISQYRENIGNPYAGHEPPGGRALRHKSDLTLLLSSSKPDEKIIDPTAARKIKIKTQKSRNVSPGVDFEYIATTSRGFSSVYTLIYHLFSLKLLEKPKGKKKFIFIPTEAEYNPIDFIKLVLTDEGAYEKYYLPIFQEIINSYPEDDREYLDKKLELIKNHYFDSDGKVKISSWTTISKSIINSLGLDTLSSENNKNENVKKKNGNSNKNKEQQ